VSYTIESDLVATCCKIAKAMRVELELVGQRRAKGSGTTRGFPDGVLHAGGRTYLVEFKRPKSVGTRAGRVSLDQVAAAERRAACGVETYLVDSVDDFTALVNWARTGRPSGQLRTITGEIARLSAAEAAEAPRVAGRAKTPPRPPCARQRG